MPTKFINSKMGGLLNKMEEQKTALLVEDNASCLKAYARYLEDRGYAVTTAMTAEQAKKFYKKQFDVAIIDGLNGECFDIYTKINATKKVIYTGDDKIIEEAKQKGMKVNDKLNGLVSTLESILENEP